jgi:hypothetical protein
VVVVPFPPERYGPEPPGLISLPAPPPPTVIVYEPGEELTEADALYCSPPAPPPAALCCPPAPPPPTARISTVDNPLGAGTVNVPDEVKA